jgi:type-1 restriction enzyme ecoDI specificity protein
MLSDRFTGWASNSDSRTILPKINKKDLYSIPVPVPLSLSGQKAIVSKVHALLSIEREVTGALQVTRSQVDELIPSLLAKAFRGDLVPQDFDDEPASELLARLAEANASENQKPIRRKRQTSV